MQRGGSPDNDRYELEIQVLRPLPVDQNDIQCFSLVGTYSQIGAPIQGGALDHCIVIDIPSDNQIPVQPGDVVGYYSDAVSDSRDNDGVQLDTNREDVTVFYQERASITPSGPSSCSLIAGNNNIADFTDFTTAAPIITVVVGKHQQATIYVQWGKSGAPSPPPLIIMSTHLAIGIFTTYSIH